MEVLNNYNDTVFWRVFKGDDTVFIIGLADGILSKGRTASWRDDSFQKIKVEIKKGHLTGAFLTRAGRQFGVADNLVVDGGGNLDLAVVSRQDAGIATQKRRDIQFFDARNFNETTEREISFSLENAFTSGEGIERSHEHSQTWTVGGKIGGELGKKDEAKVDGEVSVEFEDKVVDSLQNSFEQQVKSVWARSVKDKFRFNPGRIHAVEVTWDLEVQEGTVSYFGQQTPFSVVRSARGTLTTPSTYDSPDQMPAELRAKFESF